MHIIKSISKVEFGLSYIMFRGRNFFPVSNSLINIFFFSSSFFLDRKLVYKKCVLIWLYVPLDLRPIYHNCIIEGSLIKCPFFCFFKLTLVMELLLHYSVKFTPLLLAIGPLLKVVAAAVVEHSGIATTISEKGKKMFNKVKIDHCEKEKSLYNERKFVKCPNDRLKTIK